MLHYPKDMKMEISLSLSFLQKGYFQQHICFNMTNNSKAKDVGIKW